MKMYEVLALSNLYGAIKDKKMSLKMAYKFNHLMKTVEEEIKFYQEKFSEIVNEYGKKDEEGGFIYLEDGNSIAIIDGKQDECNMKVNELQNLEVDSITTTFTFDELDSLDLNLSIEEMNCLMPLIQE